MLSGLGFLPGIDDLPRDERLFWESDRVGAAGTAEEARRDGFLWVWDDGSTFRRPEVTASPFESCSKTAPMSDEPARDKSVPFMGITGGGALPNLGSGGGGGGPGAACDGDMGDLIDVWPD